MRLNNKQSLKLNKSILTLLSEATVTPNNSSTTYISSPSGIGVDYTLTPQNLNPANWTLQPEEDLLSDPTSNNESQPRKPGTVNPNFENLPPDPILWIQAFGLWTQQYTQNNPLPNVNDFPDTPEGNAAYRLAVQQWLRAYHNAFSNQPWYSDYERYVRGVIPPNQIREILDYIAETIGEIELGALFSPIPATMVPILGPIIAVLGDIGAILWLISQLMEVYDEGNWGEMPFFGHQFWRDIFGDRPDVTWSETEPYFHREIGRQLDELIPFTPAQQALERFTAPYLLPNFNW